MKAGKITNGLTSCFLPVCDILSVRAWITLSTESALTTPASGSTSANSAPCLLDPKLIQVSVLLDVLL